MPTRTFKVCFLHRDKSLHLVECLLLGLQVLLLQHLDLPQLVAHLVQDMDLGTIMEQWAPVWINSIQTKVENDHSS